MVGGMKVLTRGLTARMAADDWTIGHAMYRRHDSIYGRGVDRDDFSLSHLEREQ
jgi:hypothetical protein